MLNDLFDIYRFDIHQFYPFFARAEHEREIIDVDYVDLSDEINSVESSNQKLLENGKDDTRPD